MTPAAWSVCLQSRHLTVLTHVQVNPGSKTPGEGVRYLGSCSCGCCLRRLRPDPLGMVSWAPWCDRRCHLHDRAHADAANGIQHQQEVGTSYTLCMSILCGGFQPFVEVRLRQGLPSLRSLVNMLHHAGMLCWQGRHSVMDLWWALWWTWR